ncbi:hypothetical protein BJ973_000085 [Actinoplanes tereljensis]|uniref:Uncharacterized protein n=1 Tax=Paractinoplanes tereljensis TaxID=571912 RepID=A0A919TX72_9ACTN|nr:hypothetical protein [Actinoplanes tereljensis]GIF26823.1 hypothetical protein Ate02nite_95530 [Actinoplanes tereljensis]
MTGLPEVSWQRYWRARDGNTIAAESAVLLDIGLVDQAGLIPTQRVASNRCTVLLAPPGAGKSYELRVLTGSWQGDARRISLGGAGGPERLLSRIDEALCDLDTPGAMLALDSVDETSLRVAELIEFIDDVAARLPEAARLVLVCRSAAWLGSVEDVLRRHFDRSVGVFVLQPLTDADVLLYARAAGVDAAAFRTAVRASRIPGLAGSPHTLSLLVEEYRAAGDPGRALPGSQRDLFARSCRRLVSEPAGRHDPRRPADVENLLITARHLATLSLFSGRHLFTLSDVAGADHLTAADCGVEGYAAVLGTALFDTAGEDRLAFSHQTVVEFLAAEHLAGTGHSVELLRRLMHGRGGRLAPQIQAVAAWLVVMAPDRFISLLDTDPVAFIRSGVELTEPGYREALVDRLIDLAQAHELLRIHELDVAALGHPGLARRLRAVLTDPASTQDACALAIRIARHTSLVELNDVLIATALNDHRMTATRSAAGSASLALVPATPDSPLLALVNPSLDLDDPDDQLLGVGLRAHLNAGTRVPAVLRLLREPNNRDLFGTYRVVLLKDLPEKFANDEISTEEVRDSLAWAAATQPTVDDHRGLWGITEELHDAILAAGLRHLLDDQVREAVADLLVMRLDNHRPVPRSRRIRMPVPPDKTRQNLIDALRDRGLERPDLFRLVRAGILVPDDVPLSAAVLAAEPDDEPNDEPESLTEDELRGHLTQALRQKAGEAFPMFCYWARFTPGAADDDPRSSLRVVTLPGWALAEHDDVLASARDHLAVASDDGQAYSTAQALVLLSEDGDRPTLPDSQWRSLARTMMGVIAPSSDDPALAPSLQWIYGRARRELLDATSARMRESPDFAQFPLRRLAPVLTEKDVAWLRWIITDPVHHDETAAVACDRLVNLAPATAIDLLPRIGPDRERCLAVALLRHAGPAGWPAVRDLMVGNDELIRQIIGNIAGHGEAIARPLDAEQTVELWMLTDRLFPRGGDPDVQGAHLVSNRESVAILRDRMLPGLAERGTPEAVAALERIAAERPDEPLYKRIATLAQAALARTDWHPLQPREIVEILASEEVLALTTDEPADRTGFQLFSADVRGISAGLVFCALIAAGLWGRDGFEVATWIIAGALTVGGVTGWLGDGSLPKPQSHGWRRVRRHGTFFLGSVLVSVLLVAFVQRGEGRREPATRPTPAPPSASASTAVKATPGVVQPGAAGSGPSVSFSGAGPPPGR